MINICLLLEFHILIIIKQKYISPDTKNDDMCKNILEDFQKVKNIWINEIYFKDKIKRRYR